MAGTDIAPRQKKLKHRTLKVPFRRNGGAVALAMPETFIAKNLVIIGERE